MSIHNPRADRGLVLTKRGWIAAIVQASDRRFTVPACRVTVYHLRDASGAVLPRPCGKHAGSDGLCAKHRADRDRLAAP